MPWVMSANSGTFWCPRTCSLLGLAAWSLGPAQFSALHYLFTPAAVGSGRKDLAMASPSAIGTSSTSTARR